MLHTGWEGRQVIGMSDCLWGLLDGVNDAGLAVSLAFGGRPVLGHGFGVPLIVRYLLQVCDSVADARDVLCRLPYHLAHTLTLVDASGGVLTAYLAPDREVQFNGVAAATNHQGLVEWAEHAAATRTVERERRIVSLLHDDAVVGERFIAAFLEPPLYSTTYSRAFGTLTPRPTGPPRVRSSCTGLTPRGSSRSPTSARACTSRLWSSRPPRRGRLFRRSVGRSMPETRARSDGRVLWIGAAATAVAAVVFPRLEAVKNEDVAIWELDSEARVPDPLIVVLALALFALLGSWAWWRESRANRPAKVAVVSAVLGLVGVVAFFLSVPIILGGLAVTLGVEGMRRAAHEGRGRHALPGVVLGAVAFVVGAAIWLLA